MKKIVVVLGVALALSVGVAVRSSLHARTLRATLTDLRFKLDKAEAKLEPLEAKRRASKRITREFDLPAGSVQSLSFSAAVAPGTLSGKWRSSGSADNSISGFTLSDPSDAVLDSAFRDSSGIFAVKVSSPGTHTFFFENAGPQRSTPRRVFLDAEFKPD
jgi:hypothetical protein